jgi:hypothetical protein
MARTVEVSCYAPIGVMCYLRDLAPGLVSMFVARGRGEVSTRHDQIGAAIRHVRSRGEALVAFGLPHPFAGDGDVHGSDAPAGRVAPNGSNGHVRGPVAAVITEEAGGRDREASGGLAIPGYDSLSASQVVERLDGLDSEQLEAVRSSEEAHRTRRTILGKIEQLTA